MDSQTPEGFSELAVLAEKQQNVETVAEIVERVMTDGGPQPTTAGNTVD